MHYENYFKRIEISESNIYLNFQIWNYYTKIIYI
jgi:hypothetical protein